ncbi:UBA/TS-N domain-containing protein, partial [Cardiosporidium cionae]
MYVAWDSKRTGNSLYLHCKAIEIPSIHTDDLSIDGKTSSKPSKMTIGTAEGFNIQDASPEYVYEYTCVIPSKNIWISMDTPKCPEILQKVFLAIKENPGVKVTQRVMAWENDLKISRYTEDLPQVENPPKIPPSQWICAVCGETKNLWLNLSDGFIGCGRKLYNYGGGCRNGEEGAAILHFKDTHEAFPLAVKLGTITAHSADVFSYAADENDAVIDPKLADHLAYFGINIQKLEKTTKTTGELEIDQNLSYDWSRVTEDDQELEIVSGVGRRGLKNLGNSCYVNSILQVLCSIQEFTHPFLFLYGPLLNSLQSNTRCSIELAIQFGKLIYGLMTPMKCIDKTEIHPLQNQTLEDFTHFLPSSSIHDGKSDAQEENILDPSMIRNLIGKNHDEFSSYRQQDAEEYFSYLFIALLQTEKDLMKQFPSLSHFKKLNEIFNF